MIRYSDGPYLAAVIIDETCTVVGRGFTRADCQDGLDHLTDSGVVHRWEVADACVVIDCPEAALCLASVDGSTPVPMCFDHALGRTETSDVRIEVTR